MQASSRREVWGDGDPEGVRQRAAEQMKDTARAAAQLGVEVVTGFTGSSIWHKLYSFPPNDWADDRARLRGLRRALGPDHRRLRRRGRALRARGPPDRDRLRLRHRRARRSTRSTTARASGSTSTQPLHHQLLDPAAFVDEFADRIYHVHVKDSIRRLDGRTSILGSHLNFGEAGRGWDFVSPGHGDVDFEALLRALNRIGYQGPLSVEWEDSGMDRDWGAPDALAFVRATDFAPSTLAFDAAFAKEGMTLSKVGFATMGRVRAAGTTSRPIGVGMLGYGFMGKAHSNAYKTLAYMTWPPPLMPELVAIAGRNEEAVAGAARRYGFERATSPTGASWSPIRGSASSTTPGRTTSTPSRRSRRPRRASTSSARSRSGATPTRRTRPGSASQATGVKAMCAFNYRFVPGRPPGARDDRQRASSARSTTSAGATCRSGSSTPTSRWSGASTRTTAGSGALGRPRRARHRPRPLPGRRDRRRVGAATRTFVKQREGGDVTVDDAFEAVVDFASGAVGTLEASRFARAQERAAVRDQRLQGLARASTSSGSTSCRSLLGLDAGQARAGLPHRARLRGLPPVLGALVAAGPHDRLGAHLRPRDPPLPHRDPRRHRLAPHGATFEDGYRAAEICDAMLRSAESACRETVRYRS